MCGGTGFEVLTDTEPAVVPLLQINEHEFAVGAHFRFRNPHVAAKLMAHLAKVTKLDEDARRKAVERAACFDPNEGPTDLASIPFFLRWFTNTYGLHTLAAIIHDGLIRETPNAGALTSDVVSDRFFREMLHACGTGFVKRWVMWTAVALRTRWKAGGWKRAKVVLWGASSAVGMTGTIALLAAGNTVIALSFGTAMLVVAAALWGLQWGAAVFAALALPLMIPTGALALVASVVFWALDQIIRRFDAPVPAPPPIV